MRGRCGVTYYDEFYHQQPELHHMADSPGEVAEPAHATMDFFEEEIEVSEVDLYERLTIPRFDEVEEAVVWHDFQKVGQRATVCGLASRYNVGLVAS